MAIRKCMMIFHQGKRQTSFVSQGISLAINGQETTAGIASTFADYKAQYG